MSVAAILRQGGHWTQRQLLEALGVDPTDYEAMQIVRKQLDVLVDAEFIAETAKGWRWIYIIELFRADIKLRNMSKSVLYTYPYHMPHSRDGWMVNR